MTETHENLVSKIIQKHFQQEPVKITRMTVGTANEVYKVVLNDKEVVVRLSQFDKFLFGSHNHIPIFKNLAIKVPDILAEDYSKTFIPYKTGNGIFNKCLASVQDFSCLKKGKTFISD